MTEEEIKRQAEIYEEQSINLSANAMSFYDGVKWALSNQWQKIERDKDGFAIDENLGEVIIREDDGTIYINDDDDYIHNTHCVYWMPIPNLHEKLK
jgi:hypothetical protein